MHGELDSLVRLSTCGESGEVITAPVDASAAWLLAHRWVWRRRLVSDLVEASAAAGRDLFVCGIARNQREMLDLFDLVFLLAMDEATQAERLGTPDNAYRGSAVRAQIHEGRAAFEQETRSVGAVVLDARLATAVLADAVLQHATRGRS